MAKTGKPYYASRPWYGGKYILSRIKPTLLLLQGEIECLHFTVVCCCLTDSGYCDLWFFDLLMTA